MKFFSEARFNSISRQFFQLGMPTSRRKFLPEFVCELAYRRILVVEYKGEHLRNMPNEIEKDQVGRLWAERSSEKCLFLMAFEKGEQGRDVRGQLDAVIIR